MASEIAVAFIQLVPSFRGFEATTSRELSGIGGRAGDQAGRDYGRRFGTSARREIESSGLRSSFLSLAKNVALVGAGATAAAVGIAGFGIKSAANLEQVQIGFTSLLGSTEAATKQIKELQTFAKDTPFAQQDVLGFARQFAAVADSIGLARTEAIPFLTTIGDIGAITGATAPDIQNVVRQIGQMGSQGKITQENLQDLAASLPGFNAVAAIASATGQTTAQVIAQIGSGSLDAKTGVQALLQGMKDFPGAAGAMAAQAKTLTGVFSNFKDTISIELTKAFQPLVPTIKNELNRLTPVIQGALGTLAPQISAFIQDLIPVLGPLIQGLSQALGAFLQVVGPILKSLAPFIKPLADAFTQILTALQPLALAIADVFDALGPLLPLLTQMVSLLIDTGLAQVIKVAAGALHDLADGIREVKDALTGKGGLEGLNPLRFSILAPLSKLIDKGPIFEDLARNIAVMTGVIKKTASAWDPFLVKTGNAIGRMLDAIAASHGLGNAIATQLDAAARSAAGLGNAIGFVIARLQGLSGAGSALGAATVGLGTGTGLGLASVDLTGGTGGAGKIDQISGAVQRLHDQVIALRDAVAQEASAVAGAVRGTFNIAQVTSLFGEPVTLTDIKNRLRTAVANAKRFLSILKRLAREGLSRFLIQQLAEAGPDALPQAQALLSATPKDIRQLNAEFKELSGLAGDTGRFAANEFFKAGILSAQGLADGFKNGLNAKESVMVTAIRRLADRMVAELRRVLGIHSPSSVGIGIGANLGNALATGLAGQQDAVRRAAWDLMNLGTPGSQYARWGAPGGGAGQTINLTQNIHNPLAEAPSRTTPASVRRAAYALGRS